MIHPEKPLKNLLIDLGDVLYKIDMKLTLDAFQALRPADTGPIMYSKQNQHEAFSLLETGKIDAEAFSKALSEAYHLEGSPDKIIEAWNALLIGLIPGREEQIPQLAKHYNLALLSNTNQPHYEAFIDECREVFTHFQRIFLSYEMGMRKPDAEIYEAVLKEMNWKAEETLFLDDSINNIKGADSVGLQTFWVEEVHMFDELIPQLMKTVA